MKDNDLLLVGALAIGGYFLVVKPASDELNKLTHKLSDIGGGLASVISNPVQSAWDFSANAAIAEYNVVQSYVTPAENTIQNIANLAWEYSPMGIGQNVGTSIGNAIKGLFNW